MVRGERLQKVGAFSNHPTGEIAGVGGVTCYTGEVCKSGQLKWGGEFFEGRGVPVENDALV